MKQQAQASARGVIDILLSFYHRQLDDVAPLHISPMVCCFHGNEGEAIAAFCQHDRIEGRTHLPLV